jgi:FMN phosphatase YigB (HAD superfamily)
MINTLLFDFSRVLLFAKDKSYKDDLNPLNTKLLAENSNYDFMSYFELNMELLDFIETITDKFELHIFTSGLIQNNMAVKPILQRIFKSVVSAEEVGVSKKNVDGYKDVLKIINKQPNEVLFIDDSKTNIETAQVAGLEVFQFENNSELIKHINSL